MIEITKKQKEYELLDSGEGEKLERFGAFILRRPDPQAIWKKNLDTGSWIKADAYFSHGVSGKNSIWNFKNKIQKEWVITFSDLKMKISPTPFKHTGLFPEQMPNWQWMQNIIKTRKEKIKKDSDEEIKILNLFGYTGGASLSCAKAGASVCHVDGSKSAIAWGRENADLSSLSDKPIRWILDDAKAFVKKEIKRGKKYEGIIMDPPAFGHGPEGEVWKIETDLISFIDDCKKLLSDKPLFFLINGYASGYSSVAYSQNIDDLVLKYGGFLEQGELVIQENKNTDLDEKTNRFLPAGIFARWCKI